MPERPGVYGHRGARGLVPENTIASFEHAVRAGCRGLELDVLLSVDGAVVVWHDPVLDAAKCTFAGPDLSGRRVDELTVEQLRTIDVGARTLGDFPEQQPAPGQTISTLPELLAAVDDASAGADALEWVIELKIDPTDAAQVATRAQLLDGVAEAIDAAGLGQRAYVHSFDWTVLALCGDRYPELRRSALFVPVLSSEQAQLWAGPVDVERYGDDLAAAAADLGVHQLSPWHPLVDPELVDRAHELGLRVLSWTVNEPTDVQRCVEAGVDGICTDYPERVLALTHGPS